MRTSGDGNDPTRRTSRTGGVTARSHHENDPGAAGSPWDEPEKPARDIKKLLLIIGLGVLSWVATYVGMLELIEANMGELPLIHKGIIGFSVAMLMIMVVWLLDQMFAPIGFFQKTIYASGYLFLTIISIGFGFGFYWKVLESRSEATRGAESAVGQVQGSLLAASTRLEQLQGTLDTLTNISKTKAVQETATGTSCPNSRPGEGPRRKLREDDAARFQFASEFVKGRVGQVRGELTALDGDFAKIVSDDRSLIDAKSGTRNEFMRTLSRRLDNTVTGFNAFRTDPQLKTIRQDLAERADRTTFPDSKGTTFQCPDTQLAAAIKGVVRAIDELPVLEKPKIQTVEGSEATIEAFRRLTATFFGLLSFKLPPSADELRDLQKAAVQSVEPQGATARRAAAGQDQVVGLSKRDYVPLAIAIFVDLCLLLVSMVRPMNRMQSLVPKMREAERGPVYQILSKFTDIHKDAETREKFELFRHVVFDFNGDYYVAVPLDAPYNHRPRGSADANERYTRQIEELRLEASMLANLFASFEKEKIFSRVYNPMLSTKVIKRKLWRQGSKFAGSDAFRTYRFKDGAWSEIILGAVMGAAKRVDAEKRRRADRADADLSHDEPALPEIPSRRAAAHEPADDASLPGVHYPLPNVARSARRTRDTGDHIVLPMPAVQPRASGGPARPLDAIRQAAMAPRIADFEADVSVQAAANNNTLPRQSRASAQPRGPGSMPLPQAPAPAFDAPARGQAPLEDAVVIPLPHIRAAQSGMRPHSEIPLAQPPAPQLAQVAAQAHAHLPIDHGQMSHGLAIAQPPLQAPLQEAVPARVMEQPTARPAGTMVNVTLVERTATMSIPTTAAELPLELVRRATEGRIGRIDGAQAAPRMAMIAAAPQIVAAEDQLNNDTVQRLSDALKMTGNFDWQAEQNKVLGGNEPILEGELINGNEDMSAAAARFAPQSRKA